MCGQTTGGEPTGPVPPDGVRRDEIREPWQASGTTEVLRAAVDGLLEMVVVVDAGSRVVFCNQRFADVAGAADPSAVLGLRVGDVLRCRRAPDPEGCGNTPFCPGCGVVQVIAAALQGQTAVRDCSFARETPGLDLELRVRGSPFDSGARRLVLLALADISHEKRRKALEHLCFHEALGLATGVELMTRALEGAVDADGADGILALRQATRILVESLASQRDLFAAETGDLRVRPEAVNSRAVLLRLRETWRPMADANSRGLTVDPEAFDLVLRTDPLILARVLGYMVANALEAAEAGGVVTLGCDPRPDGVAFWVHNPGAMPPDVQRQIFLRSFSTKSPERGIGTWAMRLLAESSLRAGVTFTSSERAGTMFSVVCPWSLPATP